MRRIILFAVPIVLAALIALLVISRTNAPTGDSDLDEVVNQNVSVTPPPAVINTNSAVQPDQVRVQVTTVSRMFSERYASISPAAPAANLSAALPYVTASLKAVFERTIARPPAATNEGATVVSKAMAFQVQSIDQTLGRAGVVVSLQRTEHQGTRPSRTYNQDLTLQLIREGESWKVNQAILAPL